MIETEFPLSQQATAVFDANGLATIDAVGPSTPFERWEVTSTNTSTTSVAQTKLEIHDNSARSRLVEGSYSGNLDTSNTVFKVPANSGLYYRWTGGDPGAIATITLDGSRFVKGNRYG